jgi:hypothetical protein
MRIKARMGVSADGFVATAEGVPALLSMPGFVPGVSHGYPAFIENVDAVVMGRSTFLPALGAPQWPWRGLQVFVITSRPLPPQTPPEVVVLSGGPAAATRPVPMQARTRSRCRREEQLVLGSPPAEILHATADGRHPATMFGMPTDRTRPRVAMAYGARGPGTD